MTQSKSKVKTWLINLLIIIVTVTLMLALAEVVVRWVDGYQLTDIELRQDNTAIQSLD